METRIQRWVTNIILAIMGVAFLLVAIRFFSKIVLVNYLDLDSPILRVIADYTWGDVIEKKRDTATDNPSEDLVYLQNIYEKVKPVGEDSADESEWIVRYQNKMKEIEDSIETYSGNKFILYPILEKINKGFDKVVGWNVVYAREEGTDYALNTGQKYSAVEKHTMDREIEICKEIAEYSGELGADFLYIQRPYKVDLHNSQVPWGASAYENQNADVLLDELGKLHIAYLDLRNEMPKYGWSFDDGFYISDGHWKVNSAFLATKLLTNFMNSEFGYHYSNSAFDISYFTVQSYYTNNCNYMDVVDIIYPLRQTYFKFRDAYRGLEYEGDFSECILDQRLLENKRSSTLSIYSANRIRNSYLCEIQNELENDNEDKRVLLLANSFGWYVASYLALDTSTVYYSYYYDDIDTAKELIEQLQPDTVILMGE